MMGMSLTTGDVIDETMRRTVAQKRRNVPKWWKPSTARMTAGCERTRRVDFAFAEGAYWSLN